MVSCHGFSSSSLISTEILSQSIDQPVQPAPGRTFRVPLNSWNANPAFVCLTAVFLSSNQAVVLDVNLVSPRVVVEQDHM